MWCRPQDGLFAGKYLGYFFNASIYHNQVLPYIQGIKVSSVSKSAIQDTFILVPDYSEQQRIASALTSIDNLLSSLDKLIAKKRDIKQGTMQQLLTGKTRLKGFTAPWVKYKIDDLFDIGNGYTPSKANPAFWNNGTIPWFRMEDIRTNGRILRDSIQHVTPAAVKSSGLFPAFSIILSTTATIGEHALLIADSLANQRFSFLIRKLNRCSDIDIWYFFYHCFILGDWCRANINDGGLMAVNINDLKNYTIEVPSTLKEQQAIASVLSSMDSEIAALEAKRKKYEAVKQGMMQQLLTGKIRLL
jgi:type I restriction enzyme S subunit